MIDQRHNRPTQTVTSQQDTVSLAGLLDLASGYPLLEVTPGIVELFEVAALEARSFFAISDPQRITVEKKKIHERLLQSAKAAIFFESNEPLCVRCVLTGSLAIDRVLSALISYASSERMLSVHVIGTCPAFDAPWLAAGEKRGITFETVSSLGDVREFSIEALMSAASKIKKDTLGVIFIGSPVNPTGTILSRNELLMLSEFCVDKNVVLVVDHCFLYAGVHEPGAVVPIWSTSASPLKMIAIWDTGKLIGAGGHKLGFVATNCLVIDSCLREAIEVFQFELPLLELLFFSRLFTSNVAFHNEMERLRRVCRENLAWMQADDRTIGAQVSHLISCGFLLQESLHILEKPRES
jgi:hypothetical protein